MQFAIALGGACGAGARFLFDVVPSLAGFPLATLTVNVFGCFLIGLLARGRLPWRRQRMGAVLRQGLMTGLLGGFTTFAVFSQENLLLFMEGAYGLAAGYSLATVLLCLVSVGFGDRCGQWLQDRRAPGIS